MSDVATYKAVAAIEDRDRHGRGLRVEFFFHHDRYAHRVFAVGCEEVPVPLLWSVEGTPDEAWPPSPALQNLNTDDLKDVDDSVYPPPSAMLLGMSGKSHWSLSIVPFERVRRTGETTLGAPSLSFEAACRLKDSDFSVGSRYMLGGRVHATLEGSDLLLDFGSGRCFLGALPSEESSVARWQLVDDSRGAAIVVHRAKSAPLPATVRWTYIILWVAG